LRDDGMTRGKILSFLSEHFACKFQVALLQSRNLINGAITREAFRSCASNCKSRGIENTPNTSNSLIIRKQRNKCFCKITLRTCKMNAVSVDAIIQQTVAETNGIVIIVPRKNYCDHNRACVFFARKIRQRRCELRCNFLLSHFI